jgi:hypothetical protein
VLLVLEVALLLLPGIDVQWGTCLLLLLLDRG